MVSTKIQIRFADCDMMNHVNNAAYLQYFELARINFFKQQIPTWDWKTQGIILAKNTIEYKHPVFLEDDCEIRVSCTTIGNTSFTLSYSLYTYSAGVETLKTYGESVLVCFDFTTNQKLVIPETLKAVLKNNLI